MEAHDILRYRRKQTSILENLWRPWRHGLDEDVCEAVIKNNKLVDSLFHWDSSPQGHRFWSNYYHKNDNIKEAESVLRSWVRNKEPLKPLLWE